MYKIDINKRYYLKVDTHNIDDNEEVNVKITLFDKNDKILTQKNDTTKVNTNVASYPFVIEDIAKEKGVEVTDVAKASLWIDNNGDGIVEYDEEIYVEIVNNIFVKSIKGPKNIEIDKEAIFFVSSYSLDDVSIEYKNNVKWRLEIYKDVESTKPITIIDNIKNSNDYEIIEDKFTIKNLNKKWCNLNIRVYAYFKNPISSVMISKIIGFKSPMQLIRYSNNNDNDLKYNDFTMKQYYNIDSSLEYLDYPVLKNANDTELFKVMRTMCISLFSYGKLEDVVDSLISKFHTKEDPKDIFENSLLTKYVKKHEKSIIFVNNIKKMFNKELSKVNGNICAIQNKLKDISQPVFNNNIDILQGLTISINDVSEYEVNLVKYKILNLDKNLYTVKIKITLIDHFGLDTPDIEKKYRNLAGFRAWFILQHVKGYVPFKTKMEWEEEWISNF